MWSEIAHLATPSLAGIVALGVVLLFTGRLIPLSTLRREIDAERRRAEDFKAAADAADARADRLADLLRELMPYARTADAVMRTVESVATRGREAQ